MTLREDAARARDGPASEDELLGILGRVAGELKSPLTAEYLRGKMAAVRAESDAAQRAAMLRKLVPYLDWCARG